MVISVELHQIGQRARELRATGIPIDLAAEHAVAEQMAEINYDTILAEREAETERQKAICECPKPDLKYPTYWWCETCGRRWWHGISTWSALPSFGVD